MHRVHERRTCLQWKPIFCHMGLTASWPVRAQYSLLYMSAHQQADPVSIVEELK